MAIGTLTNQTIAATYKSLLKVEGDIGELLDSTPKPISDGDGNDSKLWLSTDSVLISGSGTKLNFYDDDSEYISADSGGNLTINALTSIKMKAPIINTGNQATTIELKQVVNSLAFDGESLNILNIDGLNNRVGIGTAAPAAETLATQPVYGAMIHVYNSGASVNSTINIETAGGTDATPYLSLTNQWQTWNIGVNSNSGDAAGSHLNFHDRTQNTYPFQIQTTAPSNSLYINSAGYIGIRTTNPHYPLHVRGGTANARILVASATTSEDVSIALSQGVDGTNAGWGIGLDHSNSKSLTFAYHASNGEDVSLTSDGLVVIDVTGKVGIGTDSPLQLLHVEAATQPQIIISEIETEEFLRIGVGAAGKMVIGWDDGDDLEFGLYASRSADTTVDPKMVILSSGRVGIGTTDPLFKFQVIGDAEDSYACMFHNNATSSENDADNWHGITVSCGANDGSLTGGSTTYFRATDGNGSDIGSLYHKQSDGLFTLSTTSDARLKENIVDTKVDGLDICNKIKVREFNWTNKSAIKNVAGFIAQEVQAVWADAADGTDGAMKTKVTPAVEAVEAVEAKDAVLDGDGNITEEAVEAVDAVVAVAEKTEEVIDPMSVSYMSFIPIMIKSIQELSAKVTALENA